MKALDEATLEVARDAVRERRVHDVGTVLAGSNPAPLIVELCMALFGAARTVGAHDIHIGQYNHWTSISITVATFDEVDALFAHFEASMTAATNPCGNAELVRPELRRYQGAEWRRARFPIADNVSIDITSDHRKVGDGAES